MQSIPCHFHLSPLTLILHTFSSLHFPSSLHFYSSPLPDGFRKWEKEKKEGGSEWRWRKVDSAPKCVCLYVEWGLGVNGCWKCNSSRFCAPVSLPLSLSAISLLSLQHSTLIIQIGFPWDEGMREEKGVTGGPSYCPCQSLGEWLEKSFMHPSHSWFHNLINPLMKEGDWERGRESERRVIVRWQPLHTNPAKPQLKGAAALCLPLQWLPYFHSPCLEDGSKEGKSFHCYLWGE